MRISRILLMATGAVLVGALTQTPQVHAQESGNTLVCYAWSAFPNERLKLNIERHSPLSEPEEEKKFDHYPQTAFSVHGKEVGGCGGNTMGAVTGSVVTAKEGGAHMGLVAHFSRGTGQFFGSDSCRSITFDCTTKEDSPSPDRWQCHSRNEFDVYHGISELRKVDATQDPRCSIFQNGTFTREHAQEQMQSQSLQSSAAMPGPVRTSGSPPSVAPFPLKSAPFGRPPGSQFSSLECNACKDFLVWTGYRDTDFINWACEKACRRR